MLSRLLSRPCAPLLFPHGAQLATWDIPWRNVGPWSVVAQVMEGRRLPIPAYADLPRGGPDAATFEAVYPSFTALIARCWQHNQLDRPDFQELIEALR